MFFHISKILIFWLGPFKCVILSVFHFKMGTDYSNANKIGETSQNIIGRYWINNIEMNIEYSHETKLYMIFITFALLFDRNSMAVSL